MEVFTSEVEMLRAQCREWERVCNSHLRLIKKLKKERQWISLTDEEMKKIWYSMQNIMGWYSFQEVAQAIEVKLQEKNKKNL